MRAGRRNGLSRADLALWHAFTAGIVPLPGRVRPAPPADPAPPAPPAPLPAPVPPRRAPHRPKAPELRVGEQPGGLDLRRWRKLRKGALRAERVLDLHGRRAGEAHAALCAFLIDAAAEGVRIVTVITGKGPQPEGGILWRELPHWLNAPELRALILGAAHPHPTNTGAVNILLRRRRAGR